MLTGPRCSVSPRFIEEKSSFEYGQVNHALAAAMRTLVKEYLILVTQLEQLQRQGLLSLQKLWFYIQPAMRTVDILASLGTCLPPTRLVGQRVARVVVGEGETPSSGTRHSSLGHESVRPKPVWLHVLVCGKKTLETLTDKLSSSLGSEPNLQKRHLPAGGPALL